MKDKKDVTRHLTSSGLRNKEASCIRIKFVKKSKTIAITRSTYHRYFNSTGRSMLYVKITFRDVNGNVKCKKSIGSNNAFGEDDLLNNYQVERSGWFKARADRGNRLNVNAYDQNCLRWHTAF